MRRLFFEVTRVAPFLRSERGAVHLASAAPTEPMSSGPGEERADRTSVGETLAGLHLGGSTLLRWMAARSTLTDMDASGSTWEVVDLERATLTGLRAANARLTLVSLREARISGGDLSGARLVLCDLSGAMITGGSLRGARLNGCDLSGAVLDATSLEDADLRGAVLRGAWLCTANLAGADLRGADLRHAALTAEQRTQLQGRGARLGGGWLYRIWARVLGAASAPERHTTVRAAVTATWATIAILAPVLFFARAALHPVDPDEPPFWEGEYEEPMDEGEAPE